MPIVNSSSDGAAQTLVRRESSGFAAVLRESTQAVHREAERSGFVADLLQGRATRLGYASYLANLLPLYEALELRLAGEITSQAELAFADPRLARAESLRGDLRALADGIERTALVTPEARAYAAAITDCGVGLVGHAYARTLGDLSGGQILKPLLARTLGLSPDQLSFYDFPGLDIGAAKAALRVALDTIEPASPEAPRILEAAADAFRHTIALSYAISASQNAGP